MQELERDVQHLYQRPQRGIPRGILPVPQTRLDHLDIPVAQLLPHEVVDLVQSYAQLEPVHIVRDILYQPVGLGQYPLIRQSEALRSFYDRGISQIHHDKSGCIPYLVGEVAARLHSLPVEAHIIARRVACHERHAQRVRAVFVDDLDGIDAVAERLAHLASLRVSHQSVYQNRMEGCDAGLLISGEYHPYDPEEDDIISRHQHIGRIEISHLRCIVRPAERGERPQRRREPRIQRILVLMHMPSAALGAYVYMRRRYRHLAAVVAIVRGYPMSPPELTRYAPVLDIV